MPCILQHPGQPLALRGALLDQPLAVPAARPQCRHLGSRDETGPQQPVLVQLSNPLAVLEVGLAALDIAQMCRVAHAHLDLGARQGIVDRPPVNPGAFHRRVHDTQLRQPGRHLLQRPPERLEPLDDHLPLPGASPGSRTATQTTFLFTSIPATRGWTISTAASCFSRYWIRHAARGARNKIEIL
jgi:hypothetical protein